MGTMGKVAWGVLAFAVALGAAVGALGQSAQFPNCTWNCTAKDAEVVRVYAEVSGGSCALGDPTTITIYVTFENKTRSTDYAIILIADVYVDGTFVEHLEECLGDAPPGSSVFVAGFVNVDCSSRLELRNVVVSYSTTSSTCFDDPKCAARASHCWMAPGPTQSIPIENAYLLVDFTAPSFVCLGNSAAFANATTGGRTPYSYLWEFGDGTTSTAESPSHRYALPGDYTVSLTVADASGVTSTARRDLMVAEPPFATADNGGPYCPGQTIELYGDGGVSYRWMGPAGFTSDLPNPTIPRAGGVNAGTYTVTVSDAYSCSAQATTDVFLDSTPPTLSVPPDATFECGEAYDPSIAGEGSAVDDEDPAPSVTYSDLRVVGDCGGAERILRTWIATDACGNRAMATQTITLVDTTPPSLSILDATLECDGAGNEEDIAAWLASAVATDACGSAAVENGFAGVSDRCPGTGTARVTFTASDACGNVTEAQATLSIVDSIAPDAADDQTTTHEDHAVLVRVLSNDSDLCPGELTIVEVSQTDLGRVSVVGEAIEYVPSDDMNGEAEFQYTIEDCAGHRDTALVRITVTPVNDAPTATDRTEALSEDESLALQLEGADVDGDELTFAVADGPAHGTLVGFDPTTGAVTYVPNP
ncbi:MAG: Ig-like domain-containing protein, partial [Candidatus Bipolaricaulis sp.]|nr:Ig-like domain-containing protein [Candidatus Bipolaricaulis sp.]